MAIILKDQTPSGVPTPDSGKTAIITDAGGLYIKDDAGAVTHITSGGTVTSVGVSSANSAITVTSSPITTSGTISLTANTFTSTDPGVVPGSGGGTANFLRADGTWASPPNSGGTVTSVDVSGSNGIGVSGSPITSSGTISLSLGNITPTSVAASGTVTGSNLSGTNTGDQTITLTGDVTGSGTGSFATTIAAEAVSLSKMANLAANSIIGNNTGSAATPIALTQAQFTAMVNTFSSSLSGAVPASGGGTTNFLRADGTWAAPAGGSGTVTSIDASGGSTGLSFSGGPITTSGTLTLGGTLAIANGGTGQTSKTNAFDALAPTTTTGDLIYHNGTDNVRLGIGSDGQVLTVASGSPAWAAPSGGGGSVYYKDPVRAATVANGTLSTAFANGQNIDGVTLATGDRILIKNQSTASQNGIYVVNASGAPTRASDMDVDSEAQRGCTVYVQFGNVNGGSNFQLVSSNGTPIVVGTSTLVWSPAQGIAGYGRNAWTAPTADGFNSIAIGSSAATGQNGNCIAIGVQATCGNGDAVAIGYGASAGNEGIAIGKSAVSGSGTNSIMIGSGSVGNSSAYSVHIGRGHTVAGSTYAVAIGNTLLSRDYTVVLGNRATADFIGEIALSTGAFVTAGDMKISIFPMRMTTTDATATEIGTSSGGSGVSITPSNRIILTNDSSYLFDCDIVARNTATDTESKVWNVKFGIRRGAAAANTALIGTPTYTVFGEDTGTTTWGVTVTADTTNGRPNISVTGEASKTIRWVANIRMTKVSG